MVGQKDTFGFSNLSTVSGQDFGVQTSVLDPDSAAWTVASVTSAEFGAKVD